MASKERSHERKHALGTVLATWLPEAAGLSARSNAREDPSPACRDAKWNAKIIDVRTGQLKELSAGLGDEKGQCGKFCI